MQFTHDKVGHEHHTTSAAPPPASAVAEPQIDALPPVDILPATQFTFAELTAAYNQTRVGYIVPMPMNEARLREYVHNYSVDMERSIVALAGEQILGLSMLGVRGKTTWVTRLGVLPVKRRRGTGLLLMTNHLEQSYALGAETVWLEVIKDNVPAHTLFKKLGFIETRELLVLRRPPLLLERLTLEVPPYEAEFVGGEEAFTLLAQRADDPNWLNQTPSLRNVGQLEGLCVSVPHWGWGWIVFQHSLYQLSRLTIQVEEGDFPSVVRALLHALHSRHPRHDTKHENMAVTDPRWPILQEFGYIVSFRRIEMRLDL